MEADDAGSLLAVAATLAAVLAISTLAALKGKYTSERWWGSCSRWLA